jgi:hypothetical protein
MKRRRTILGVCTLAGAGMVGLGAAQPPAPGPAPIKVQAVPLVATVSAELSARLAKLTPENPEGYFLLAEEVADVAPEDPQARLAHTLYVLAFEVDRRRPQGGGLAASCALGLARIERLDRDRRWLASLAGAVDYRYVQPDWNVAAAPLFSDDVALKAANVLGLTRAGEGREARKILDQPGVMDVLRRYERAIGSSGETGALSRLDKYMQAWPCPECNNERVVRRQGEHGVELRLCPLCHGNPGPVLSDEEFVAQLRFEEALLNGIQRSWAAQIVVDQGAPLRDPDPDELAAYYGVDASKVYWRAGNWSSAP